MEVLGILFDVKEVLKGGFSGPDKNVFFPDGHVGKSTVEVDRFIPRVSLTVYLGLILIVCDQD